MRVLGVDPGLDTTGYALVDADGARRRVVEAGVVRSIARDTLARRLAALHSGVAEILTEHHPDVLVLEELYAHYAHPTTAILMGHARGVICLAAAAADVPVIGYLPTRIKKAIVGRGHATKAQMQRMIQTLLQLRALPEPSDVADALALALAHVHIVTMERLYNSHAYGTGYRDGNKRCAAARRYRPSRRLVPARLVR